MPSDLTIPQRVTLLTESGQSNQMVRVFPAINRRVLFFLSFLFLSLSFLFFFFFFFFEGGGKPGKKIKAAILCSHCHNPKFAFKTEEDLELK